MSSVLRRIDHSHPFAPFLAEDLAQIKSSFQNGFDPFQMDQNGSTCLMVAAGRGHAEAAHMALKLCSDPEKLALAKNHAGMDAFDVAAERGATMAMSVIAKHLPRGYASSSGRSLLWHAVEASVGEPSLAEIWLFNLCLSGHQPSAPEALARAVALDWKPGIARLTELITAQAQSPGSSQADS